MKRPLAGALLLLLSFACFPGHARSEEAPLNTVEKGSGPPVVLIHGSQGSLLDFQASILDALSEKHRTVAVDLAGHGHSARPREVMTLFDHAELLHETLNALSVRRPVLVGSSWGGAVVLAYALKYPEETAGLVLLGAYVTPYEHLSAVNRVSTTPVLGDLFVHLVVPLAARLKSSEFYFKDAFHPDEPPADYARKALALARRPEPFRWNAQDMKSLNASLKAMGPRWSELRMPVTIVTGDSDAVALPERHAYRIHRVIPHSRLVVLPRTGHLPVFTKPREVISVIEEMA